MAQHQEFISQIHALAESPWAAQLLFTALDTGIFTHLQSPIAPETLAAQLNWDPRATRAVLEALRTLGLIERTGGHYQNTPLTNHCLVPDSEAYQGNFLRHMQRTNEVWAHLSTTLQTGASIKHGRHPESSEALREFALAMDGLAQTNAPAIAQQLDLSPFHSMLDLGAGLGAYTTAFLSACPNLHATLFDVPPVIEMARQKLSETSLAPRCRCLAGDYFKDPMGNHYDLIWMANVLHALGEADINSLLKRCFDALQPGGVLMIKDFFPDESNALFCALFSLNIMLHTDSGRLYTISEIDEYTRQAGFTQGHLLSLGKKARLWTTQKPHPIATPE
ncbi:MAG TPA: methyltransferase [Candidatus Hydrogenedentes bacterium]|nr:methyltransferase [Candidatus Hydrogenedentota bacterium]